MSHFLIFTNALLAALIRSAPYLVFGYLIAAVIREYIPKDMLVKYLGRKGTRPLLNAVAIGGLLPVCSCGAIPLGIGLHRAGAARGTVLAFMMSTPAISPATIILGLSLLGPKMVGIHACCVIIGSFLLGLFGNRLLDKQGVQADTARGKQYMPIDKPVSSAGPVRRFLHACKWAFWDLGAEVSIDLLFGLSLAAVVIAFLPLEWVATWLGKQQFLTLLYVIIIGIPVYTCSVPSIPVVQNLLLLGASPGAAVAYLIAGPGTNLGELNAIWHGMGKRTAIYYTICLFTISFAAGMLTDQVFFRNYHYRASVINSQLIVEQCCVPGIFSESVQSTSFRTTLANTPTWYLPFAAILAVILILGAYRKINIIWVDPCQHCQFWNEVSETAVCAGPCWVKRTHAFFARFRKSPGEIAGPVK